MKKKYYLLLLITICLAINSGLYAQSKDKKKDKQEKDKKEIKEPYLFYGGALWAGFGNYTFVDVNLLFGSQLTERFSLGVSGKYQYYNDKRYIAGDFETSVYGGSVFSQFAVIKDFRDLLKVKTHSGIIAHAEYEFLNTKYNFAYFDDPGADKDRYWLHNILIGGGYFQQMGKKAKTYIILLWNVNKTNDNPYEYPQIRIGFTITI